MRLRRTLATGAALAVSTVGLVAVSTSSAEAARLAACHSSKTYSLSSSSSWSRFVRMPITNGPSTSCSLMMGDSGAGVKTLQRSLNFCYNAGLTVDGSFGSKTRDALKKAQDVTSGLTVDGIYGPDTRKKIEWMVDWINDTTSMSKCEKVSL